MRKRPPTSVEALLLMPVSTFRTTTSVPGSMAPLESRVVPEIVAELTCALELLERSSIPTSKARDAGILRIVFIRTPSFDQIQVVCSGPESAPRCERKFPEATSGSMLTLCAAVCQQDFATKNRRPRSSCLAALWCDFVEKVGLLKREAKRKLQLPWC